MKAADYYAPPALPAAVTLDLSKNEGRRPFVVDAPTDAACDRWRRYPSVERLRARLAQTYEVSPARLLVTAGGDDALLRLCLAALAPGRNALVATPTFEMIPRYVALAGAELRSAPWPEGAFPTEPLRAQSDDATRLVFVVSPNNPTGCTANFEAVQRLAMALPRAWIVLDAAYAEFADEDLTERVEALANVVVVRTLSKAWSMAGLRVGCAIARPDLVQQLQAAGNPMPVSSESARRACLQLEGARDDMREHVRIVRDQRERLRQQLAAFGFAPVASQANFVLVRGVRAQWLTAALASRGVGVRRFEGRPELRDAVRITVPGTEAEFEQLLDALASAVAQRERNDG